MSEARIPSRFRPLISDEDAAFIAKPPEEAWQICLALTNPRPDLWAGGTGLWEGEAIVWQFFYDKHGADARLVEVEQHRGSFRVVSDTGHFRRTAD